MIKRTVRQAHRQYKIEPSKLLMSKILRANEKLAASESVHQHMIVRLQLAIKDEKKRRK